MKKPLKRFDWSLLGMNVFFMKYNFHYFLFTLCPHLQRGGRSVEGGPEAGGPQWLGERRGLGSIYWTSHQHHRKLFPGEILIPPPLKYWLAKMCMIEQWRWLQNKARKQIERLILIPPSVQLFDVFNYSSVPTSPLSFIHFYLIWASCQRFPT